MAIIRRIRFTPSGDLDPNDIALIDTPEKLLTFAKLKGFDPVPLDVAAVAEKFGIHVEYISLEDNISGILYKDEENNRWVLHVNKEHHPNRLRYTIAHELGHFCLHRHLKQVFEDQIFFRGGESSKEEWQANEFACAILMPEKEFRDEVRSGKRKVDELAKVFQVSTLALRIRAKNLGMSGHGL
jgi:Zn-dependent peptidase ImmA (M78 family)